MGKWLVALGVVFGLGCASQRQWVPVNAQDIPTGNDAFVTVQSNAIHLRSVEHQGGLLVGEVVDAWALPPGAGSIADSGDPASIAGQAGWPRSQLVHGKISIAVSQVTSTRVPLEVPSGPVSSPGSGLIIAAVVLVLPILAIAIFCDHCGPGPATR